ncbi:MAG: hypothetical protein GF344_05930, partial [Chitinivibrionales bacterium]|nr:hypothetical protein [Chitinivibrionales bacterium]MBD3356487.1 hypothetical protein [Chitinivibrionales bacterium]
MKKRTVCHLICVLAMSVGTAHADPYTYRPADRAGVDRNVDGKVAILPQTFLREYDPVTVFFKKNQVDTAVAVEDSPSGYMKIEPRHPGEYIWIDTKTLEFRPTIPWPPTKQFTVTAEGESKKLFTLLTPPTSITPRNKATDLDEVRMVYMTFGYSVPIEKLKKLVSFELTPLPGIDRSTSTFYTAVDYSVKASEESDSGAVTYSFTFTNPIALGYMVRTHLKLSDAKGLEHGARVYSFSTKRVFKPAGAGIGESMFSIADDGSSYSIDNALELGRDRRITVAFTSKLGNVSITEFKNLVSFSPTPRAVDYRISGKNILVTLKVDPDRLYKVMLSPTPIQDAVGRKLNMTKPSSFYVFARARREYIRWPESFGLLEQYGPQHIPLAIQGVESFDLRVYKIDPLHKAFWPFPQSAVVVDESELPPGPGEEPIDESEI